MRNGHLTNHCDPPKSCRNLLNAHPACGYKQDKHGNPLKITVVFFAQIAHRTLTKRGSLLATMPSRTLGLQLCPLYQRCRPKERQNLKMSPFLKNWNLLWYVAFGFSACSLASIVFGTHPASWQSLKLL